MNNEVAKPWYREFWVWIVLAPLILAVVVGTWMVSVAVKYSDDTVSDTYYKDSLMYHYTAHQDQRAAELGLTGMLQFDRADNTVAVELSGDLAYPEQLLLTLSHPAEADLDVHVPITQVSAGRYVGELVRPPQHRWYLRLMPEMDPEKHLDAEWRLKGEINFDLGDAAPLNPAK